MYTGAPTGLRFPLPQLAPIIIAVMSDQLDDMDSSITTTEFEQLVSPVSAGTASSSPSNNNEVTLVTTGAPTDSFMHPVTTATMENFDGEAFNIDGIQYLLKDIKVDHLRKFCVKNGVKCTQPPHKSVRTSTKKIVVEEIKAKKVILHIVICILR